VTNPILARIVSSGFGARLNQLVGGEPSVDGAAATSARKTVRASVGSEVKFSRFDL
jgi:hypothetical protein